MLICFTRTPIHVKWLQEQQRHLTQFRKTKVEIRLGEAYIRNRK